MVKLIYDYIAGSIDGTLTGKCLSLKEPISAAVWKGPSLDNSLCFRQLLAVQGCISPVCAHSLAAQGLDGKEGFSAALW